ncbi:MAG: hypothetical protein H8K03_21635 [Nitrospira sp.]
MEMMFADVAEIMVEHGLVELQEDAEALALDVMNVLKAQGHVNANGDIVAGRFILLPSRSPEVSVLLVSPLPADPYDDELRRKPSPIQFDRTANGQIALPGRTMLTIIEELASNPVVHEELQVLCLNFSRCAPPLQDIVLPPEAETIALPTERQDVIEALVPGCILTLNLETNP